MNVYDFDKTIYPRDSATDFFCWCARRYPRTLLCLPPAAVTALRGRRDPQLHGLVKERIYAFRRFVPDPAAEAAAFWDARLGDVYPWYLDRKRPDDVIISASPAFLVGEACRRLGVECIATEMDTATGKLLSPNCRGTEKIVRYRTAHGGEPVDEFYSDSWSDRPMMDIAAAAWRMKKGVPAERVK